jgi:hypothetical protein
MLKIVAVGVAALLLWSCILTPGKFDARLDLKRDGSFAYRYEGEIQLLTPHAALDWMAQGDVWDPKAQRCWDEPGDDSGLAPVGNEVEVTIDEAMGGGDGRDCTPEELESRRAEWEKRQREQKAQMEAMRGFFGGVDPRDPAAVAEFVRRVTGYDGWKRVVHKGNGVFDVLYEVKGRSDRDFVFPVFPEVDVVIPFVRMSRRTDGSLRIAAPAFSQNEEMLGGPAVGAALAAQAATKGGLPATFRRPEGRFTVATDGEVLTNNTESGPVAGPAGMKQLIWTVTPLDKKKPEALIRL